MITFVIVKNIYDCHEYSAFRVVAKTNNYILNCNHKYHSLQIFNYYSHNGSCLLQLYIYIINTLKHKS